MHTALLLYVYAVVNRQLRSEVKGKRKNLRIQLGFEPRALMAVERRLWVSLGASSNLATSLFNLSDGGAQL